HQFWLIMAAAFVRVACAASNNNAGDGATWGGSVGAPRWTLSNGERAPNEIENAAVDQEQRAADHDGTDDLAPGNAFAQHEITEQQGRYWDQQRHQHDVAQARSF